MTKVAIIGGGFFGTCIALKLKEKNPKFNINIYEKRDDILKGTSGKNQFRCHRGYHYPRSKNTFLECQKSYESFKGIFKKSFINSENFYAISKKNSKTNFDNYLHFLNDVNLKYEITKHPLIKESAVQGIIKAQEKIIDINKARKIIKKKIIELDINLFLNNEINLNLEFKNKYDLIILATYDNNNFLKKKIGLNTDKYFYQLVEKIIIKTPPKFNKFSCVILDGDFVSIDPYQANHHIIGHVTKSVIFKQESKNKFYLSKKFANFLNDYEVENPDRSNFGKIKKDFNIFFNHFNPTRYAKSFYVIRCTKRNKDDERVTNIDFHNKIISVHSGKWINCVEAGNEIAKLI